MANWITVCGNLCLTVGDNLAVIVKDKRKKVYRCTAYKIIQTENGKHGDYKFSFPYRKTIEEVKKMVEENSLFAEPKAQQPEKTTPPQPKTSTEYFKSKGIHPEKMWWND